MTMTTQEKRTCANCEFGVIWDRGQVTCESSAFTDPTNPDRCPVWKPKKRDAEADLKLYDEATPGRWEAFQTDDDLDDDHYQIWSVIDDPDLGPVTNCTVAIIPAFVEKDGSGAGEDAAKANLILVAEAHKALPHWIRRAVEAEKRVAELEKALTTAEAPYNLCENCPDPIACDGEPSCDKRAEADAAARLAIAEALEVKQP